MFECVVLYVHGGSVCLLTLMLIIKARDIISDQHPAGSLVCVLVEDRKKAGCDMLNNGWFHLQYIPGNAFTLHTKIMYTYT